MVHLRRATVLVPALTLLGGAATAQAPNIRVAGRAQVQYRASSGDSSGNYNPLLVSNGFEIRRLRIQADVRFGDNVTMVVQPSFEMGTLRMRDAFLRVGVTPRFGVTAGQEKTPFQRYELTSSNTLPSIERGLRVLRLSGKEGLNDLLVANGYGSHDLGAFVDFAAPANRVTAKLGFQNGSRESVADVNSSKSFYGRVTATLFTDPAEQPLIQVGASLASRDRAVCNAAANGGNGCTTQLAFFADSAKRTTALGLDAEWGGFRPGWHVIADFATGDNVPLSRRVNTGRNTANVRNTSDTNVVTFRGGHLVAAYRIVTGGSDTRLIPIVEPALRLDYTDPDTDTSDDEGVLVTPALNIHFGNTVVLRTAFDLYRYTDATGASRTASELKFSWQANF